MLKFTPFAPSDDPDFIEAREEIAKAQEAIAKLAEHRGVEPKDARPRVQRKDKSDTNNMSNLKNDLYEPGELARILDAIENRFPGFSDNDRQLVLAGIEDQIDTFDFSKRHPVGDTMVRPLPALVAKAISESVPDQRDAVHYMAIIQRGDY